MFVKYDNAALIFRIFDEGIPFDLTGFTHAEVLHRRPDGVTVIGQGSIENDSNGDKVIKYNYLGNEMYKTGLVATTLSVFSGDKKVSIQPFKVNIVADFKDAMVDPANPEYGALQHLIARVDRLVIETTETLTEVMEALEVVEGVTQEAYDAIDAMQSATNEAINTMEDATDTAIAATNEVIGRAEDSIVNMDEAYDTTVLIWKAHVPTYDEIELHYPNPEVGWTVQVFDTGIRYRWDGIEWVPIEQAGGNIPTASNVMDGLMSSDDYRLLHGITEHANTRMIVFIVPQEVLAGIQDPHVKFPFNGEIVQMDAMLSKSGTANTIIRVEKSRDMVSWENIMASNIAILSGEMMDAGSHSLSDRVVNANDIFRLNIIQSSDVENLTLNITIKLTD